LRYIDAGVSGGIHGLEGGYCLMLGGTPKSIEMFEPFAKRLAPHAERGWLHCGPSGAGHFAKMVHNGIEYGMMQSLAEGFALLAARPELDIDVGRLADTWRHGSVVRSWLLDLAASALSQDPGLESLKGVVEDSGEGRWTVQAAVEEGVTANVLAAALFTRFRSRQVATFGEKLLSAMRRGFGGHREAPRGDEG
jgi:6-phosphogluconate dehydrogenase